MKKRLFFIGSCFFVFLVVLTWVSSSFFVKKSNIQQQGNILPTPIIFQQNLTPATPLDIVSVTPQDGATGVSTKAQIVFIFNKSVSLQDVSVWLGPNTNYSVKTDLNKLIITPSAQLLTGTVYTFSLKFINDSFSKDYSFTTRGVGPISNPKTLDSFSATANSWEQSFRPDIFVSNKTPFQGNDFAVRSEYSDLPTGHMAFSVILLSQNGKAGFLSWLSSLGLTNQQIQSLDITYMGSE